MNYSNFPKFIVDANTGTIHMASGLVSMCKFDTWRSASIGSEVLADAIRMIEITKRQALRCPHCTPESEVR